MAAIVRQPIKSAAPSWPAGSPASPAVRMGDLLFTSGQIAVDGDFQPLYPGDVAAQTRHAFDNIRTLVDAAGGSMNDVLEMMVFVRDPRDLPSIYDVARDYFDGDYPAWTVIGSIGLQHPETLVSLRAIAHLGSESKQCITPDTLRWMRQHPMSAGCRKGDYLFVSGQVAADTDGLLIGSGDHAAQARYCCNRIREITEAAGGTLDDVIDVISFHQDARGMGPAVDVWTHEFMEGLPFDEVAALTAIGTHALPQLGMLGSYRAIADFSGGKRVAKTPPSIWWKVEAIAGGTKKEHGHLIGLAGQVASDGDGLITTPGDTAAQARYAFNRIAEVLDAFGATMDNVAEVISFHKDPRAWEIVMDVGREYFPVDAGPAWTPVGATGLFQEGYLHEIYTVAVV